MLFRSAIFTRKQAAKKKSKIEKKDLTRAVMNPHTSSIATIGYTDGGRKAYMTCEENTLGIRTVAGHAALAVVLGYLFAAFVASIVIR